MNMETMDHLGGPYAALSSSSTKRRKAELSALRQQLQNSGKIPGLLVLETSS